MARILANTDLLTGIKAVLAYEDDNTTLKCWTTKNSSDITAITPTGITRLDGQTFGSSTASCFVNDLNTDKIVVNTPITLTTANGNYTSYYAAIVDFDAFAGSTQSAVVDFSEDSTAYAYGMGIGFGGPGNGSTANIIAAQTTDSINANCSGSTVLAGDTKFGIGSWLKWTTSGGTNNTGFFYGAAGSAGGTDGPVALLTNNVGGAAAAIRAFTNCAAAFSRQLQGKVMVIAVWNRQLTTAEFQTLNVDPIGALFAGGAALDPIIMSWRV